MTDTIQQLIETLQQELRYQQELAQVLDNKLDAMRHYDLPRLEALTRNERRLVEILQGHDSQRAQAVRGAVRHLWPRQSRPRATCRELAEACREPQRSHLLTLSAMLAEVAEKVQRLNRIGAIATRKIMNHFDIVFQAIAQSGRDIGLYGRAGKKTGLEPHRLVDALA
ncbi:MAG: flagellar export chaperone FlgN [Sedimentisphaerales bacterium]|nr:flagellar export chaperone FlgN [Sedimentisphaerales bacterium]